MHGRFWLALGVFKDPLLAAKNVTSEMAKVLSGGNRRVVDPAIPPMWLAKNIQITPAFIPFWPKGPTDHLQNL